ncbi:hypothetical protein PRIPAC_84684 [Pristionchus pacificus]|uniref:Uncharacterized protein n=1 Tax=Pristionchus pacificus TaxID=54126 RepID=A0A2A6BT87_PRIPA|nr:hypothetical protein PRIPAC_84684 [Pristionchus pacificus]|eukprot:PDM68981.1 hypothetical protein PRIPAC_47283 [Pristionchus pacificus]
MRLDYPIDAEVKSLVTLPNVRSPLFPVCPLSISYTLSQLPKRSELCQTPPDLLDSLANGLIFNRTSKTVDRTTERGDRHQCLARVEHWPQRWKAAPNKVLQSGRE